MRNLLIVITSLTVLAMASVASCQSGPEDTDGPPIVAFSAVANVASLRFSFGNMQLNQIDMACRSDAGGTGFASIGLYLVAADVKCMSLGIRFQRAAQATRN